MTAEADHGRAPSGELGTLARGGAINLVGGIAQAVAQFGLLLALGRLLGAAGSGEFLEAIAIFSIVTAIATLGVETGFIRSISQLRVSGTLGDIRKVLVAGFVPVGVAGLVTLVALLTAAGALGQLFGGDAHSASIAGYVRVMAWFAPMAALLTATLGATRAFETMLPTVLIDRVGRLGLQSLLVLTALLLGVDAELLSLAWSLPIALALIASAYWLHHLIEQRRGRARATGSPTPWRVVARGFWTFTAPRALASVFRTTVLWLDVLLVGAVLSPREAGVYALATRTLQFGKMAEFSVGQAAQPTISRLMVDGRVQRTKSVYAYATGWQVAMAWPQYIAIAIFAPTVLRLFGSDFAEGSPTVAILAVSLLIGSALGPVDMVLLMSGKSMWGLWNTALSLTVNLGLNILLIPRLGIEGAAISWAVARILDNVVPLVQIRIAFGLHPFGRVWLTSATGCLVCFGLPGVLVRATLGTTIPAFLVYFAIAVTSYAGWLYVWRSRLQLMRVIDAVLRPRVSRRRTRVRPDVSVGVASGRW